MAPKNFGWAGHKVLISEVDSGEVSVFEPKTGEFLGELSDADGNPLVIDGVWAIIFAHDNDESPTLFFSAGCAFPSGYSPSLFGVIRVAEGDIANRSGNGIRSVASAGRSSRILFRNR